MKNNKFPKVFIIIIVVSIAFGLRTHAAKNLYIDYDEPVYLQAAIEYTNYIRNNDYTWLAWSDTNYEHPPFYKILYGVILLSRPPIPQINDSDIIIGTPIANAQAVDYGMTGRWTSVILSIIAVTITAMVNPLAGLFLATNTASVKFSSLVYLESLPLLTSLLSVICYISFFNCYSKSKANVKKAGAWLVLSSVFLGITAASKYIYCVVGIAIIIHAIFAVLTKKLPNSILKWIVGWGVISVIVFFIADPYLWPNPFDRFMDSILFHANYPKSSAVANYDYPWYQPVLWLFRPFEYYDPRPTTAFLINIDTLIFVFAVIGLHRTAHTQSVIFIWLMMGLIILLLWGTKWPQYVLILMVPYCSTAAMGVITMFEGAKRIINRSCRQNKS